MPWHLRYTCASACFGQYVPSVVATKPVLTAMASVAPVGVNVPGAGLP